MSIFVIFDCDIDFEGHMLQELDGQIHCDYFDEYLMKIGWCQIYSTFYLLLPVTHFSPEKRRLSYVVTSIHYAHFLEDFEYLNHNLQKSRIN